MNNYSPGDLIMLNSGKAVIIDEIIEPGYYYGSDDDGAEYNFSDNQVLALSCKQNSNNEKRTV